jgi:glycosyltransferase involved in cell wall biosynthesis
LRLVSFLNITPFKQLFIGFNTLLKLLGWGWRNRHQRNRIIGIYNLTVPPGIFVWTAARLCGAKVVVFLCDVNVPGETVASTFFTRFDYRMQKWLLRKFDGRVAVSDAGMRDLCPGSPYIRMEGGVTKETIDKLCNLQRARVSRSSEFVIAAAGRINETNGTSLIIGAMELLPSNFRLLIAGSGPSEELLQLAAVKDSRIQYFGMQPFERVLELYGRADLLLNIRLTKSLNTRYFFPGKFMEYVASGTPVLSTCTGHVKEEFGEFVYLLEDETAEGLASRILEIANITAEKRQQRATAAQEYMRRKKNWASQSMRVADYFSSLFREDIAHARVGN